VLRGPENLGAELETPRAAEGVERVSPPQPTRALGEHDKLPQWGPGQTRLALIFFPNLLGGG